MRVISVNVGQPRDVEWKGEIVRTSIWKEPVSGPVAIGGDNLVGDRQSDLSVHGGPLKAVYAYPAEHYLDWKRELPEVEFPYGVFGENLTVEGLDEATLQIGDRLAVGSAELQVTQPRMPCYKLGIRFGREDMLKRFLRSGRTGFYFSVVREGTVEAGDGIEFVARDGRGLSVADVTRIYAEKERDPGLLRVAMEHPVLPESWRGWIGELLGS